MVNITYFYSVKMIKEIDTSKVIGSNCGLHECIGRDKWIVHDEPSRTRLELQSDRNRYLQAAFTTELTRKMYKRNRSSPNRSPPNWRYTFLGVHILGDAECEQFKPTECDSPWSEWDDCSAACGSGQSARRRICFGKLEEDQTPCQAVDINGNSITCRTYDL